MRKETLALAIVMALNLGCRSSEENVGGMPAVAETEKADDDRRDPQDAYERKRIGEVNRAEGRRDAAGERNRRIDEKPVQHPPEPAPPAEEEPPR